MMALFFTPVRFRFRRLLGWLPWCNKKNRDATSDGHWKHGDFVRGVVHPLGVIMKAGPKRRRGDAKGGDVAADFAVGAASDASNM
jgi:hypothetical protein